MTKTQSRTSRTNGILKATNSQAGQAGQAGQKHNLSGLSRYLIQAGQQWGYIPVGYIPSLSALDRGTCDVTGSDQIQNKVVRPNSTR
jgi:hypothetical protein